jgi:hypothetical protein
MVARPLPRSQESYSSHLSLSVFVRRAELCILDDERLAEVLLDFCGVVHCVGAEPKWCPGSVWDLVHFDDLFGQERHSHGLKKAKRVSHRVRTDDLSRVRRT